MPNKITASITVALLFLSSNGTQAQEVLSHEIHIKVIPNQKRIEGDCTILASPPTSAAGYLAFGLLDGTVLSVDLDGVPSTNYTYQTFPGISEENDWAQLVVPIPQGVTGDTVRIRVQYYDDDMYATYTLEGLMDLMVLGQVDSTAGSYSSHLSWYPFIQSVGNSADIYITVPDGHTAVTSGALIGTSIPESGWKTYHWHTDSPSGQLMYPFSENNYEVISAVGADSTPIQIYYLPEDETYAQQRIGPLKDIFDYYLNVFGAYPFSKLAIAELNPLEVRIYQPTGVQRGDVTVPFVIVDGDSSAVSLLAEFSSDQGTTWLAAAVTGDTIGIVKADYDSNLVWNSDDNFTGQDVDGVWFRVTPRDSDGTGTADTTFISIDNRAPQWITAEGTSGDSTLTFWFDELVADSTATDTSNISLTGGLTAGSITGIDHDVWSTKASVSINKHDPAAGVIDGLLYVAGGLSEGLFESILEVYDPSIDSWMTKASMPTARRDAAAGVIDGELYVVGPAGTWIYDPSTDNWTTKTTIPAGSGGNSTGGVLPFINIGATENDWFIIRSPVVPYLEA